jgi:hypothetical protein
VQGTGTGTDEGKGFRWIVQAHDRTRVSAAVGRISWGVLGLKQGRPVGRKPKTPVSSSPPRTRPIEEGADPVPRSHSQEGADPGRPEKKTPVGGGRVGEKEDFTGTSGMGTSFSLENTNWEITTFRPDPHLIQIVVFFITSTSC